MDKRKGVPGRWTKCWGKASAKRGVKIVKMWDAARKCELE